MTEDLLDRLVTIVGEHYAQPDAPLLLLSRFGQANKDLLAELKIEFGTLMAAIRAAGLERLRIVDDRVGRESMAPAAVASEIEQKIREQSVVEKQGGTSFDSLPNAVQIAFCIRTSAGEYVAVRVTSPFYFEKVRSLDLLRPGFRYLADHYRKPGLILRNASWHEREALWRAFVAWTEEQGIDPAVFNLKGETNALLRLLAAQPPDVLSRLMIPADIASILLKRP